MSAAAQGMSLIRIALAPLRYVYDHNPGDRDHPRAPHLGPVDRPVRQRPSRGWPPPSAWHESHSAANAFDNDRRRPAAALSGRGRAPP